MKPNTVYLLTIIFGLVLALSLYLIYEQLTEPYPFQVEEAGIVFKSKTDAPGTLLQDAKISPRFIVSPAIVENTPQSQYMSVASNNVIVVLKANQKAVTQLARSVTPNNILEKCASNDGNLLNTRELDKAECTALLQDSDAVVILIEQPDSSLPRPEVIVEPYRITIQANDITDVPRVSLETMKAMYPNSEEIILVINQLLSQLQ